MAKHSRLENLKKFLKNKRWIKHTILGIILLLFSFYFMSYVASWRENIQTTTVGDLIVDALPATDLDVPILLVMYASCLIMSLGMLYYNPERFPCLFKSVALLFFVRGLSIPLTHLGHPNGFILMGPADPLFSQFYFTKDFFFSGHTALLFLGFLMHDKRWIKTTLLIGSILVTIMLLMMHVHYSIDVFAAYFMSYGVYAICKRVLKKNIE